MRTVLLALLLLTTLTPSAQAAGITEVTGFGTNPGNLRMFRYVPDDLPAGRPVVVALHGCTQDAAGYGTASGWVALADRYRFSVLLPQQQTTNNANKCFSWFQTADTTRGQGEAASIAQMVTKMAAGPAYVTGLSAGGAMTSVMLATYPESFRGGGIVAGLPHGCAASIIDAYTCMNPGKNLTPQQWGDKVRAASPYTGPRPPVTIWHGTADYTVATANQRELVDQWTNALGTDTTPDTTDTVAGYPHSTYRAPSGTPAVETYTLTTMGHGQPVDPGTGPKQCGTATAYVLDVNICAAWYLAHGWGLDA
ncbi:extracellular catalytic domain type 1 short-chain-length polyhydroxyalkanoate depolymerase [Umezawaea tangerina]|uniref:Poly(Hydroxyalkanoate) depolymerase family esterase n=1 Tax=Umezawaea tangerina TaxID=84725 RepID=A0A2T0SBY9_9PSEU|nr:PHB depolymerase family esterase [Umezawaea tangerina]PRY30938.1 poly(hydroxyalkanoate) depolymerase family esterase [Umezawaea tangerina]